jgi:HEAT repeat protein
MSASNALGVPMTDRPQALSLRCVVALLVLTAAVPWSAAAQKQTREVPVDSIIFDLKSPDPVRRKEAASTLGKNKIQRAVPDLVAAAGDSDAAVRREIVIALDRIRDAGALPAFVDRCADQEKDIREKAIEGLINLYLSQDSGLGVTFGKVANFLNPWSDEWAEVVVEPGVPIDPRTVEALRSRLQDSDEGIRIKAARGLGIVRGKAAAPALAEATTMDTSNSARFECVRAVRKIGDPTAAKPLMNLLSYPDHKVRNEAVYALGRLRAKEAVPEMTRLLDEEASKPLKEIDKDYMERLLGALAFIGDAQSKDVYLRFRQSPEAALRMHAAEGLARTGDASIAPDISRDRLVEKDARVRTAQAFALYRMQRKEYLDEVVRALGTRQANREATEYLVSLRPEEMPELYQQVDNNDNASIREGLAEVLGLIGDPRALPSLETLTRDSRGQIAALANQAIRRINARSSGPK